MMKFNFLKFMVFWGVNTLSLWIADDIFLGLEVDGISSLFISGLLLGLVNSFLKPLLIILTLPLSILSLGFSVLIISGLMLIFVGWVVPGFTVSSFWTGVFAALFISIFSFIVNALIGYNKVTYRRL